jgi:hypothetical protein
MGRGSISTLLAAGVIALALGACGRGASGDAVVSSAQPAASNGAVLPPAPSSALPVAAAVNPGPDVLPSEVGSCTETTVKTVGPRLEGTPGSGSAIEYADGGTQVSYDQVPGIDNSRVGDSVKLCLVSLPQDCPAGDDRGKVYAATNLRTGETWSQPDSEHSCGGA